jgi:CheY-like chemotaxis protein
MYQARTLTRQILRSFILPLSRLYLTTYNLKTQHQHPPYYAFQAIQPPTAPADNLNANADVEPCPSSRSRVLVVDDHRDAADTLASVLNLRGCEVETAYDGEQSVQAASTFRPRLALVDLGLLKANGYQMTQRIRRQPWSQGMVLATLTGWSQGDDNRRTREAVSTIK